jgi:hypothetical protein
MKSDYRKIYEEFARNIQKPKNQKFPNGSRIMIIDKLSYSMSHFPSGVLATVESACDTGQGIKYSLNVDGYGSNSWYHEDQIKTAPDGAA